MVIQNTEKVHACIHALWLDPEPSCCLVWMAWFLVPSAVFGKLAVLHIALQL